MMARRTHWRGSTDVNNSSVVAETDKVWLASYHLTGIAQHWYFQLERDAGLPSWSRLKEL